MNYVVGGCNVQCTCYTQHGRYGLSCLYAETVESMSTMQVIDHVCRHGDNARDDDWQQEQL